MTLYSTLFYAPEINELLSEKNTVGRMLQAESALGKSQASVGIIPVQAAELIAGCCNVNFIDLERIKSSLPLDGNAAIPLVQQLIRVVKNNDFEASKYVHLGATSQDIVDTALVLAIRDYSNWLESRLKELGSLLNELTSKHRSTVMIGRTLLQQAKPITFGLKTAGWLQGVMDSDQRLQESKARVLKIQLAGAVGSGSVYLSKEVRDLFAKTLGLENGTPWQSNRGNLAEWVSDLGILSGQLGKIAKDISLMMQTEVAEAFEGLEENKGGSSTLPHKRNPVICATVIASAQRVPHLVSSMMSGLVQEHERSAGLWQAEWEVVEQLMGLTAGSLEKTVDLIRNLEIDQHKMKQNLELTRGLIYAENVSLALTPLLGKDKAHQWVQKACQQAIKSNSHLKDILVASGYALPNLEELFNPELSIGNSQEMINEVLKNYENQL